PRQTLRAGAWEPDEGPIARCIERRVGGGAGHVPVIGDAGGLAADPHAELWIRLTGVVKPRDGLPTAALPAVAGGPSVMRNRVDRQAVVAFECDTLFARRDNEWCSNLVFLILGTADPAIV